MLPWLPWFLDLNKLWSCRLLWLIIAKRLTCTTFLCTITLGDRMVAHTFLPSFDNANGCLCQKRLLWSRTFATMVAWCHTPPLYTGWLFNIDLTNLRVFQEIKNESDWWKSKIIIPWQVDLIMSVPLRMP